MSTTNPSPTLYVRNIDDKVKTSELRAQLYALFSSYGRIQDIRATKGTKMRGQAFLVFADLAGATTAMRACEGIPFYDKPLVSLLMNPLALASVLSLSLVCSTSNMLAARLTQRSDCKIQTLSRLHSQRQKARRLQRWRLHLHQDPKARTLGHLLNGHATMTSRTPNASRSGRRLTRLATMMTTRWRSKRTKMLQRLLQQVPQLVRFSSYYLRAVVVLTSHGSQLLVGSNGHLQQRSSSQTSPKKSQKTCCPFSSSSTSHSISRFRSLTLRGTDTKDSSQPQSPSRRILPSSLVPPPTRKQRWLRSSTTRPTLRRRPKTRSTDSQSKRAGRSPYSLYDLARESNLCIYLPVWPKFLVHFQSGDVVRQAVWYISKKYMGMQQENESTARDDSTNAITVGKCMRVLGTDAGDSSK